MGFSFSKTEKMLYTLHLFLAHPVLLVLRLIVPSVEQLCIVISQKKLRLFYESTLSVFPELLNVIIIINVLRLMAFQKLVITGIITVSLILIFLNIDDTGHS